MVVGPDLPNDDLGVSDDIVGLGKVEDVGEAALAGAKGALDLGAAASSLRSSGS